MNKYVEHESIPLVVTGSYLFIYLFVYLFISLFRNSLLVINLLYLRSKFVEYRIKAETRFTERLC